MLLGCITLEWLLDLLGLLAAILVTLIATWAGHVLVQSPSVDQEPSHLTLRLLAALSLQMAVGWAWRGAFRTILVAEQLAAGWRFIVAALATLLASASIAAFLSRARRASDRRIFWLTATEMFAGQSGCLG